MIALNVPGPHRSQMMAGEMRARQIMDFSSPVLSIIVKQHNNRRALCGFGLADRFCAAHLKEMKEQL
jgi:hypothetical protein